VRRDGSEGDGYEQTQPDIWGDRPGGAGNQGARADERAILETAARTADRINKRRAIAALPIKAQLAVQPVIPNDGC
jgi:hypothetical protein